MLIGVDVNQKIYLVASVLAACCFNFAYFREEEDYEAVEINGRSCSANFHFLVLLWWGN